ncbi:abortive infection protein, AbiV family [Hydrobacter penzbergensis]|uniref:Abortive infection protein, AbiV family n=1 Tax=Hydrobacter penzbergensis TaxID=1235997 RepID=A0A8X8LEI6_9BACT|nr:AbiV family abortive infection protein [Hydrobacter penzbergensis]SDX00193.1 abortive infection protein, AbiV family [Hydrobacter penzbergensis]
MKPMITFANLTAVECGVVYYHVRNNAATHLRVARLLEKHEEYANAIAHLILGSEEFIKAVVLLLESKGFSLRAMKKYNKLFYNHSARHIIISDFYSIWMAVRTLFDIPSKKQGESSPSHWMNVFSGVAKGFLESLDNHSWWKAADDHKQHCFYVDYENKVLLPSVFSKQHYLEAKKHVDRFLFDLRTIVVVLLRADEQQLNEYKRILWSDDIPDILNQAIPKWL